MNSLNTEINYNEQHSGDASLVYETLLVLPTIKKEYLKLTE